MRGDERGRCGKRDPGADANAGLFIRATAVW